MTTAAPDLVGLLGRVALGDRQAFRRLYDATAPSLLGVALRMTRDRGRAEDVVQDAFVNVWQRADRYREEAGSPMAWLVAIVRNRALDEMRTTARLAADALDEDESGMGDIADERPEPLTLLAQAADAMAIRACRKAGKYIGICGQGPSDHPDFARWLVDQGIDSLSLNPDTVVDTWLFLAGASPAA